MISVLECLRNEAFAGGVRQITKQQAKLVSLSWPLYKNWKEDCARIFITEEQAEENLKENGIELEELLADGGYSSGEALAYLHEKNINAYIPNFGQYKSEREGFMFHKEENYYQCTKPEGNQAKLLFKGVKSPPSPEDVIKVARLYEGYVFDTNVGAEDVVKAPASIADLPDDDIEF